MTLARDLDMQLIAEGVEAIEQVALLQALNCDLAQGFIFSRAIPLPDLARALQTELGGLRAAA